MPSAHQRASHRDTACPSHRCGYASACLTTVDICGGICSMCARRVPPAASHFLITAANDGSAFVSPPRNGGTIFHMRCGSPAEQDGGQIRVGPVGHSPPYQFTAGMLPSNATS